MRGEEIVITQDMTVEVALIASIITNITIED